MDVITVTFIQKILKLTSNATDILLSYMCCIFAV